MTEVALLQNYLAVGAMLFGIGLAGFLVRRNLIVMFLCAEMMLQGISLSFIAWGRLHGDWGGQMMVVFIITVAACEAGIALALVFMLCRSSGNLDIVSWQDAREDCMPAFVDEQIPEEPGDGDTIWPTLTPAGNQPEVDPEDEMYRTRV